MQKPGEEDPEALPERWLDYREKARAEQREAIDLSRMAATQACGKFTAPRDRQQHHRRAVFGLRQPAIDEIGDVIEQAAKARRIAAIALVQTRTAAIEVIDRVSRRAQAAARVLVPATVALDAMQANDVGARGLPGIVAAVLRFVTIAGSPTGDLRRRFKQ